MLVYAGVIWLSDICFSHSDDGWHFFMMSGKFGPISSALHTLMTCGFFVSFFAKAGQPKNLITFAEVS